MQALSRPTLPGRASLVAHRRPQPARQSVRLLARCQAAGAVPPPMRSPVATLAEAASGVLQGVALSMKRAFEQAAQQIDAANVNDQLRQSLKSMRTLALVLPLATVTMHRGDTLFVLTKSVASFLKARLGRSGTRTGQPSRVEQLQRAPAELAHNRIVAPACPPNCAPALPLCPAALPAAAVCARAAELVPYLQVVGPATVARHPPGQRAATSPRPTARWPVPARCLATPLVLPRPQHDPWQDLPQSRLPAPLACITGLHHQPAPSLATLQVTDPYLALFTNLLPPLLGAIDLTPLLGFMVLQTLAGWLELPPANPEDAYWQ